MKMSNVNQSVNQTTQNQERSSNSDASPNSTKRNNDEPREFAKNKELSLLKDSAKTRGSSVTPSTSTDKLPVSRQLRSSSDAVRPPSHRISVRAIQAQKNANMREIQDELIKEREALKTRQSLKRGSSRLLDELEGIEPEQKDDDLKKSVLPVETTPAQSDLTPKEEYIPNPTLIQKRLSVPILKPSATPPVPIVLEPTPEKSTLESPPVLVQFTEENGSIRRNSIHAAPPRPGSPNHLSAQSVRPSRSDSVGSNDDEDDTEEEVINRGIESINTLLTLITTKEEDDESNKSNSNSAAKSESNQETETTGEEDESTISTDQSELSDEDVEPELKPEPQTKKKKTPEERRSSLRKSTSEGVTRKEPGKMAITKIKSETEIDLGRTSESSTPEESPKQSPRSSSKLEKVNRLSKFFGIEDERLVRSMSTVEEDPIGTIHTLDQFLERKRSSSRSPLREAKQRNVTLEEILKKKLQKDNEKLSIAEDLPRLLKRITVFYNGKKMELPNLKELLNQPTRDLSGVSGSEMEEIRTQLHAQYVNGLRDFFTILCETLQEPSETAALIDTFFKDLDMSISKDLSGVVRKLMGLLSSTSPVLRCLKAINQTIIAAPYIQIKNQFDGISAPFSDVANKWMVNIIVTTPTEGTTPPPHPVTIIHTKYGKSTFEKDKEYFFEFSWDLKMTFDTGVANLTSAAVLIDSVTFSEDFPKDKKKEITDLIKNFYSTQTLDKIQETKTPIINKAPSLRKRGELKRTLTPGYHDLVRVGTAGERKFVEELLGPNKQPLYMQWGTSLQGDKKIVDRLLVISDYRSYFIKRTKLGKKKIANEAHLYELKSVTSLDQDKVIVEFRNFTLDFSSAASGDIVPNILHKAYHKIAWSFPQETKLKVFIDPPDRIPLDPPELGVGKGFVDMYAAFCDFYNTPIHQGFVNFVKSTVATGSRELVLSDCPGFAQNSSEQIDLTPIAATLRYNSYFKALICKGAVRKDAITKFSLAIEHNRTLNKVVLTDLEATDGFDRFGEAMKVNIRNLIVELDLSRNPIKEKNVTTLAEGLSSLAKLTSFKLSQCGLTPNGVVSVWKHLGHSFKMSCNLIEVDMSFNDFGVYGSSAIARWFANHARDQDFLIPPNYCLKRLFLANTNLDLFNFFNALRISAFSEVLETLDISGNKFEEQDLSEMMSYLAETRVLKTLKLSGCNLSAKTAVRILTGISINDKLVDFEIDLSNNNFAGNAVSMGPILKMAKNVGTLNLSNNGLKKEVVCQLLRSLYENKGLKNLDISMNKCGRHSVDVLTGITLLMGEQSSLHSLNISGLKLGKDLGSVFDVLVRNKTLTCLDISSNNIGDLAAVELGAALSRNHLLKTLKIDRNKITLEGWKAISNGVKEGETLTTLPIPYHDINKAVSNSRDKQKAFQEINSAMLRLKKRLKRNVPRLTSVRGVAVCHDRNPQFREQMEDEDIIEDSFGNDPNRGFFAVMDGHGGRPVVDHLVKRFHKHILKELANKDHVKEGALDYTAVLKSGFKSTDEEIVALDITKGGSTAVACLVAVNEKGQRWIHCANIGDARAVLWHNNTVTRLSYDHKASDGKEIERVVASKGLIFAGRLGGTLAVTRAFGDLELKKVGLITDPYVTSTLLAESYTPIKARAKRSHSDSIGMSQIKQPFSLKRSLERTSSTIHGLAKGRNKLTTSSSDIALDMKEREQLKKKDAHTMSAYTSGAKRRSSPEINLKHFVNPLMSEGLIPTPGSNNTNATNTANNNNSPSTQPESDSEDDDTVSKIPEDSTNSFVIIACDGLWDVVSDEEAVDLVKGMKDCSAMSDLLMNYALEKGTTDNLTVMVVRL